MGSKYATETGRTKPRGNCFLTLIQNYEDSKTCCER